MVGERARERLGALGEIGLWVLLVRVVLWIRGTTDEEPAPITPGWVAVGAGHGLLQGWAEDRDVTALGPRVLLGAAAFTKEVVGASERTDVWQGPPDELRSRWYSYTIGEFVGRVCNRFWYGVVRPRPDGEGPPSGG